MNKTLANTLAFLSGAAIGSVVTWKLIKDRYKQYAQEEIDSVIAEFRGTDKTEEPKTAAEPRKSLNTQKVDYSSIIKNQGYDNHSTPVNNTRVISPEEVGDDDYDVVSLTYYADDVLAYDDDTVVTDIDALVGLDSLNHFGEYEDDAVHVRNDDKKTDYEILLDNRKYSTVVPTSKASNENT